MSDEDEREVTPATIAPEETFERILAIADEALAEDEEPPVKKKRLNVNDYIEKSPKEEPKDYNAHMWLVTFTDTMALMLTFFVMMYAMSEVDDERWTQMAASLNKDYGEVHSEEQFFSGTQETITIDKVNLEQAQDLDYLKALFEEASDASDALNVITFETYKDRIEINFMASDLFDDTGSLKLETADVAHALSPLLSKLKNRAEIIYNVALGEETLGFSEELKKSMQFSELLYETGSRFLYPIRAVNISSEVEVQQDRLSFIIWNHAGRETGFVSFEE